MSAESKTGRDARSGDPGGAGDSGVPGASASGPHDSGAGILGRPYRWVTVGMLTMILLSAFEVLAVTTVMPTISGELDGASLYALAFSGPLAVGIVGMVVVGNWSDRSGPRRPLFGSVALFAGGLVIAGFATNMELLVLGRLISGLGGGGLTVALFVLVARVFPERLHPKIFASFAAAWVIPSLVGPLVAGLTAQTVGWRWVFLAVVVLVALAMFMVIPPMRGFASASTGEPWKLSRIVWSMVAAVAVLIASLSGQLAEQLETPVVWMLAAAAIVIAVVSLRTLLPAGALVARAGLPTVILLRGLVSGSYFAAETYLPYFFTSQYALSPALAGLALSIAGLSWAGASWLQGKYSARISDVASIRLGIGLVLFALAVVTACAVFALPSVIAIVGWLFAGAGMGTMYPRLSVAMLRLSTPTDQGFNSSALSISDSIGAAASLALTAAIFSTAASVDALSFTQCFLLAAVLGLTALSVSGRARS